MDFLHALTSRPSPLMERSLLMPTSTHSLHDPLAEMSTNRASQPGSHSITFIDSSAPDYEFLASSVRAGTEVYVLDAAQDAIAQITQVLSGRSGISSLNIVSHGEVGSIDFASLRLDQQGLDRYASTLQTWSNALTQDADIVLYGCDIAQGLQGETFVRQLSVLTGADVAASNDLTGSAQLGGDWELEFSTGSIETGSLYEPWAQAAYNHVLATFAVINTNDSGAGSLRQAILDANTLAGADEIIFQLGGGAQTITLTSGQLDIAGDLTITGTGRNNLTISGNNASRMFQINSGINATLTGLTIADGTAFTGGGLQNQGKLEIRNSTFKNNSSVNGSAIANGLFSGDNSAVTLTVDNVLFTENQGGLGGALNNFATATVRRSTFSNNTSSESGGIFNQGSGTLLVERSTFSNNSAGAGGGIRSNGNLTVRNSTFSNNQVSSTGGGIAVTSSAATTVVEGSTFSGNSAETGGGLYNFGTLTLSNSTFTTNTATRGGGFFNQGRTTTVSYSRFTNNTATGDGGGIYNQSFAPDGILKLEFSQVDNNTAANGGGIFNAAGNTVRVKASRIRQNLLADPTVGVGADLNGTFISEGGNQIGDALGSTGFLNRRLGDRVS